MPVAAVKANHRRADGDARRRKHYVSLDTAIKTMRETGADMAEKYKETA